jgi:hypothetical protein
MVDGQGDNPFPYGRSLCPPGQLKQPPEVKALSGTVPHFIWDPGGQLGQQERRQSRNQLLYL